MKNKWLLDVLIVAGLFLSSVYTVFGIIQDRGVSQPFTWRELFARKVSIREYPWQRLIIEGLAMLLLTLVAVAYRANH
jgi:hypothetical protein